MDLIDDKQGMRCPNLQLIISSVITLCMFDDYFNKILIADGW